MTQLVASVRDQLKTLYLPREPGLAFLALSGKIENYVRDRLASRLNDQFSDDSALVVAREWKRRDLAIFRHTQLVLVLEAKAAFAFDLVRPLGKTNDFATILSEDTRKVHETARKHGQIGYDVLNLLLVVNPAGVVPTRFALHQKYLLRKTASSELQTYAELSSSLKAHLGGLELLQTGRWTAGKAFDTEVEVCYWLYSSSHHEA